MSKIDHFDRLTFWALEKAQNHNGFELVQILKTKEPMATHSAICESLAAASYHLIQRANRTQDHESDVLRIQAHRCVSAEALLREQMTTVHARYSM